jgi:hypothetical protein
MSGEIRMAADMGLLVGVYRSPVQFKALFIKGYLDIIRDISTRRDQRVEALKFAMGASGHWTFESLFPEAFKGVSAQQSTSVAAAPVEQVVDSESWSADQRWDYSAVEWKTPTTAKAEYDEIMRKLAAKSTGTMNGTQITTPQWPHMGKWR